MSVCQYCGEPLVGKRRHAEYCDSTCRADASRVRNELRGGEKAHRSVASDSQHPLAEARADQEASELKSRLSELVYQGIIDQLRFGPCHADDLEPIFPAGHVALCRKLTGAQFGSLVSRGYILEVERRRSKIRSRNSAKSGVYELTRLGREKLTAGVSAGVPGEQSPEGAISPLPAASANPGDQSRKAGGSEGHSQEEENSEPARLFEDEEPKAKAPSAFDPFRDSEAAA